MKPTERLQAIKDAAHYLQWAKEHVEDAPCIIEINIALEALAPIISGEMVVVPVHPTAIRALLNKEPK